MDYWPSYIPKPSSLSESVDDPYIEATSETGDDSARVRYSKERQGPTKLTWKIMRLGDFVALKQFYADHRAIEFLWLHPSRGLTYKTRFVSSPISSSEDGKSPFVAQVEVTLQIVELAPTEQEQPSASDLMDTINAGADKAVQAAIDAEQARDDAKEYAKKAAASAKEAADTAAEISAAVEAGIERIEEAGASQISAVNSAGSTQVSKVNSAGTKQTTAVNNAGAAQVSKVNSAGTSQVAAVEDAGSEQIAAVKTEGKAQTAAAKKQADAAAASAEEAAERLAEFKDLGATAKTLAAGSNATASFDSSTGVITIGVPSGKKGDKGDPGTFSEDGVTVVANASGEAMAKDVAIGGNASDLASARGIFDTLSKGSVDCNTLTEQGVYAISYKRTVNGPGFSAKLIVFSGKNSKLTNQMALGVGAVTSGSVCVAYRSQKSEDIWSPWSEGILSGRLGDGLRFSGGRLSVPEYEGATASAAGTSGLVPPAAAGEENFVLHGDGTYRPVTPSWEVFNNFRKSMIGISFPFPSTTLPEGFVWADGSLILFEDYPEVKEKYEAGGFDGMLLAWDADEETIAAKLGKWRPNAANPTGLFVPNWGGQFSRAWTPGDSADAGAWGRDEIRELSGVITNVGGGHNLIPIGTGVFTGAGKVAAQNFRVNEDNIAGGITNITFCASNVVPTGQQNVPQHVWQPHAIYLGLTA